MCCSIPGHPARTVQAGAGFDHLGVQTHHAQRGGHGPQHPVCVAAQRGSGGGGGAELLPDVLHGHPAAHLLGGHGQLTHGRPHHARHHPGLHVHSGREQQDHCAARHHAPVREEYGVRSGVPGQPAESRIPSLK